MAEEKTASAKLVDSVALTLFARVAMIIATSLILPVAIWMGNRGISTIDEISKKIDAMKEVSIEQSVEMRAQQRILADQQSTHIVDRADDSLGFPLKRGLTPAVESVLVGLDLDEDPVAHICVHDQAGDARDLHNIL